MRFIHTSDWHVGKTLKGRDRLDEQRGVLAEITQIAVIGFSAYPNITGDPFDLATEEHRSWKRG